MRRKWVTLLMNLKLNGIISDRPDYLWEVASNYDGDNDGKPDFLDIDGLIDINKFDAQGHRGGRNLRPENTLPSMEVALDYLMTTLEADCGITKDGVPVLSHDSYLQAEKVRKLDGSIYEEKDEILIKELLFQEIQTQFIADKLLIGRPDQKNDRNLSPVSIAFAKEADLKDVYIIPSLSQLFEFVDFYAEYYKSGLGKNHPMALRRWKNALKVRFNIETKINPRSDKDKKGNIFSERTFGPEVFSEAIGKEIISGNLADKADIQSFDFRTLLDVQKKYPEIRTVCLFGDFPKFDGERSDDGTNLQDENGANTPWLAGLYWPYRVTKDYNAFKAKASGGFEGMAYDKLGERLYPLLEKPLEGAQGNNLLIHTFNLKTRSYLKKRFVYEMDPRAKAIGEFILYSPKKGLIIERDNTQGDMDGFKIIYEIKLLPESNSVKKRLATNLLDIADPFGISKSMIGDVGLGRRFGFPFVTIESVVFLNKYMIGVLNDNNFPFSVGRHIGSGQPDDNEFIILFLDKPLGSSIDDDISLVKQKIENPNLEFNVAPNPFTNTVRFNIKGMEKGDFKLIIFDHFGQEVKSINFSTTSGTETVIWEGASLNGTPVPPGMYFGVLDMKNKAEVIKFIKAK